MSLNRYSTFAALAAAALSLGACTETLNGGNACPSLCPEQQLGYQDVELTAAEAIDTIVTILGSPSIGTETRLLLARYQQSDQGANDSVISDLVIRFDSVQRLLPILDASGQPLPLIGVDTAGLYLNMYAPPTGLDTIYVQDSVTLNVYNVDVDAPDLDTAAVHARFVPQYLVGSHKVGPDSVIGGAIRLPLDTAFIRAAVTTAHRVRLGVEVVGDKNARIVLLSQSGFLAAGGYAFKLSYSGVNGTQKSTLSTTPLSRGSSFGPAIPELSDYQIVVKGSPPVAAGMLAIGGLPSNRVYVRFKIPVTLIDSTATVVRAYLLLHQVPFTAFSDTVDSVTMQPYATLASPTLTDLSKATIMIADVTLIPMRSTFLPPSGAGLDTISLVRTGANIFNFWRTEKDAVQRAIVLTIVNEGIDPRELLFYDNTAPPNLQPRVHLSYVPRSQIGQP